MVNSTDLLAKLYNAFNPFEPLPAGDPKYVDCQDVRGDADIEQELGNRMRLAERDKILEPFIAAIAEDFLNDPELTEFSV
jgi:hypothetical protein